MTLSYTCRHPETRPIGKGIMAEYDGTVLVISKGHRLTAITAEPGDEISITVTEKEIAATGVQVRMAAKKNNLP